MIAPGKSPQARLRSNPLKPKLKSYGFVVGTFLQLPSPALAELLGLAGFDFVVVDCEHGTIDLKDTADLIRAGLASEISVMVRTPNCEPTAISLPLEMGASAIQVPQVETVETAQQVVSASKHHPQGCRGLQPRVRSASYRAYDTSEYLAVANRGTTIAVQVEGKKGVSNLEGILKVEGVDIAFVGPYDLSQFLGIPGQIKDQCVRAAIPEAVRVARSIGKYIGLYCDGVETAS